MNIRIELRSNNYHCDITCDVCGQQFDGTMYLPTVVEDGQSDGDMCWDCFDAGPRRIKAKLRRRRRNDLKYWLKLREDFDPDRHTTYLDQNIEEAKKALAEKINVMFPSKDEVERIQAEVDARMKD